jgi:hypothetical protein
MSDQLLNALQQIGVVGDSKSSLDLSRMTTVIDRDRRQLLATAETRLSDVLSDPVITGLFTPFPSKRQSFFLAKELSGRLLVRQCEWTRSSCKFPRFGALRYPFEVDGRAMGCFVAKVS